MTLPQMLLDTDILSIFMRRPASLRVKARPYLAEHGRFTFSLITKYEILRGLKAKKAQRQLERFEERCSRSIILPIGDDVIERASDIYADLKRRGELIGDADILIAACALVNGMGVVTNNERHFKRIGGLTVENWLT